MASEAPIEANRPHPQKHTGRKTEGRKARERLNALKNRPPARTVDLVLPQEDPKDLDSRIQQWFDDLQPQNAVEREMVSRAARLSWTLDRAERHETAHLAHRAAKPNCGSAGGAWIRSASWAASCCTTPGRAP
jgi:hypothetical protein